MKRIASLVLAATLVSAAHADDPVPAGRLLETPGPCEIRDADDAPWHAIDLKAPAIRPGQRIRCAQGGALALRLPGNQRQVTVTLGQGGEYVVPIGENNPPPPDASRAGRSAQASPGALESCPRPLGVLRVAESPAQAEALKARGLGPPSALLREMALRSGCFVLADRLDRVAGRETQIDGWIVDYDATAAAARPVVKGVPNYVMTPEVQVASTRVGGALGGLGGIGAIGGIVGHRPTAEATTRLHVVDAESAILLVVAGGNSSPGGGEAGAAAIGSLAAASAAGYEATAEGRAVAASLLDGFNRVVAELRDEQVLERAGYKGSTSASEAASVGSAASAPAVAKPVSPR